MTPYYTIERGHGSTYTQRNGVTVYKHDIYPRHSVLAGQDRRIFVETFPTVEEAQAKYPKATIISGTTFREPDLTHLPDDRDY